MRKSNQFLGLAHLQRRRNMDIKITTSDGITIAGISGSLDANTAPQAQDEIMPLVIPACRLILDMGDCEYVSSAGLRLLLMIAKRIKATEDSKWCLASVSEEIMDVMEMTGFAQFFQTFDSVEEATKAIQEGE
jgi:anti-anti-sigma factor